MVDDSVLGIEEIQFLSGISETIYRTKAEKTSNSFSIVSESDRKVLRASWNQVFSQGPRQALRAQVGDQVNLIWPNLAAWCVIPWAASDYPFFIYEVDKEVHSMLRELTSSVPWHLKLLTGLALPKNFKSVKDMNRMTGFFGKAFSDSGIGSWSYCSEESKEDEHHFHVYGNSSCWGLEKIGASTGFIQLGGLAGIIRAFEKEERDWDAIETHCIGKGDPYCELVFSPGTFDVKNHLRSINFGVAQTVYSRLVEHLLGYLVLDKGLPARKGMAQTVFVDRMLALTSIPSLINTRYRRSLQFGGARLGIAVGNRMLQSGLRPPEITQRVFGFLNSSKVGKVSAADDIRIEENCEITGLLSGERSCFFTTGFLNGLYYSISGQTVRETKCVGLGDPYCAWEVR
jgi:predicted hydrocarbon binding protein